MPDWAWRWIAPLLFLLTIIAPLAMILIGSAMDFAKVRPALARWLMRTGATMVCAFIVVGGVIGALVASGDGVDWRALALIGLIVFGTEGTMYFWNRFRPRG